MALLLKGNELIATGPLSANVLSQLAGMAARRPLVINGVELCAQDLMQLAEKARRTEQPVWPAPPARNDHQGEHPHGDQIAFLRVSTSPNAGDPSFLPLELQHEAGQMDQVDAMRTHRKKVLEHAARRFSKVTHLTEPNEISRKLRSFLKIEDERLRIAHRLGASGRWTARARSLVLDIFVGHILRIASQAGGGVESNAGREKGCAIVALGGYGRRELAPFSDLDLLFLHGGRRSVQTREMIERILHLLWDSGMTVGHRDHSVSESILAARGDPHFQTALITMRLVAGNEAYFDRLTLALERERQKKAGALIATVLDEHHLRRRKFGVAACLQEPNVKEGSGGLRDLHTALWMAYAKNRCRTFDELRALSLLPADQLIRAEMAYDFMLRVRNEAHWTTARKTDRLALDLQPALAQKFGYVSSRHLQASEQFMRDYYRRARELQLFTESLLARPAAEKERPARWFGRSRREHLDSIFSIKEGRLQLDADKSMLAQKPSLFMRAFSLAQAADVSFSHDLRDAISRSLAAVDREFRGSAESAGSFLALLRRRGRVGRALRLMHETGFLGRYLPEFNRISLLIQHDLYHHYTIDEHTLLAVEALDEITNNEQAVGPHLHAAFREVEDIALLYLSVLLHDLGKGRGSGHVARGAKIAERICRRLHLDGTSAARVVTLVNQHVLMTHISQRRDLSEPRLIMDFARKVGDLDTLNMLLLLSHADLKAVGPGVWSEWKSALLKDLYQRARAHLTAQGASREMDAGDLEQLKGQVVTLLKGKATTGEVERHFALLPDRYARTTSADSVATHLLLVDQLQGDVIICHWSSHSSGDTELTICARDRRGLFADLSGALAAQGIEILSADINTRADGFAIDSLVLREAATHQAVLEHRRPAIERTLKSVIAGRQDVASMVERWRTRNAPRRLQSVAAMRRRIAIRAPRIYFDNEAAEITTAVEVRAADEPGLAYKIASVLTSFGLDIVCARIATEKSDALDVFYVTNEHGVKLSTAEMLGLEEALTLSLSAPNGEATAALHGREAREQQR